MKIYRIDIQPAEFKALKPSPKLIWVLGAYLALSIGIAIAFFYLKWVEKNRFQTRHQVAASLAQLNNLELAKYRIQDGETRLLLEKAEQIKLILERQGLPWYRILNELESSVVPKIFVTELTRKESRFNLKCFALELNDAITFYTHLLERDLFSQVYYGDVKLDAELHGNKGLFFTLQFTVNPVRGGR